MVVQVEAALTMPPLAGNPAETVLTLDPLIAKTASTDALETFALIRKELVMGMGFAGVNVKSELMFGPAVAVVPSNIFVLLPAPL